MAYEISTANGHANMLAKIRTFVETALPLAERYTVLRQVTNGTSDEVIWQAPGLSGTEEIFMGAKIYQSVSSDYYNLKVRVFTGYVPGNSFETQPGGCATMSVPLWNQTIPYWLVANGQRIILQAKVENIYTGFYIGNYLKYSTPAQYAYAVFCGAALGTDSATRYSDTFYKSFYKGAGSNCALRFVDGSWRNIDMIPFTEVSFPFQSQGKHQLRNTISSSGTATGYYGLHPIIMSDSSPNDYGELDGLYYISGFNNAVENTLTIDTVSYVVLRDTWRTGFNDYVALRLQ